MAQFWLKIPYPNHTRREHDIFKWNGQTVMYLFAIFLLFFTLKNACVVFFCLCFWRVLWRRHFLINTFSFLVFFTESSKTHRSIFSLKGVHFASHKMASSSGGVLKDLVHPSLNEALKTQNSVTFKLVKTGKWWNNFY